MPPVVVLILTPESTPRAGPLEQALHAAWAALAEHHRAGFLDAGADEVVIRREPPDDTPFGARLRRLAGELRLDAPSGGGLIVLGAGAIPLATPTDLRAFVEAASSAVPGALANQRFSADVVALARAGEALRELPDLRSDNGLPRWLAERAGIPVRDLARRRRLAVDLDSPLDVLLVAGATGTPPLPLPPADLAACATDRFARLRALARDPAAELLVAGRTSANDLRWAERHTRSRTRALVEERGLRSAETGEVLGRPNRRRPRSLLGELLDRAGVATLGTLLAGLADGALVDSRVLLAHRLGADERAWPSPEDRFASDLLLPERIADPWLRALTESARDAGIPILLGGHGLVGPGLRLALGAPRAGSR